MILQRIIGSRGSGKTTVALSQAYANSPAGLLSLYACRSMDDDMSKPDHAILAAVMSAKTIADLLGEQPTVANVRKLRVQIHPDRFDSDNTAWRRLDGSIPRRSSSGASRTGRTNSRRTSRPRSRPACARELARWSARRWRS